MAEPIVLPPKYYLSYFDYLVDFVKSMYGQLMNDAELQFLSAYEDLPEDSRCLFIRMSNRKGRYFKAGSLDYPEIEDTAASLEILIRSGFARPPVFSGNRDLESLFDMLTKGELMTVAGALKPVIMPLKSIRKPDLVRWLIHDYEPEPLFGTAISEGNIVEVLYSEEVDLLKFLFFGNRYDDMSEFVIRDLGHVRFQSFEEETLSQRFQSRKEIDDAWAVSRFRETFYEKTLTEIPQVLYEWFILGHSDLMADLSPSAAPGLERLALKAAGWMEKQKLPVQALELYELTTLPPARERKVRLLHKLGFVDEAAGLCEEMKAAPQNADELYFGNDFLAKLSRSGKRLVRQTTRALHEADQISVPFTFRHQVETGAAHHYIRQGYAAFFSENIPWRAIFGLLFWDVIYDQNVQAIHHPLQRVPSDFFLPDFYQKRAHLLQQKKEALDSIEKIRTNLAQTFHDKYGTANVMVSWYDELLDQLLAITRYLDAEQLLLILMEMATDLRDKTRGFPDLFVWKENEYCFVEIKSPNDHLSSRQLYWQHFFRDIGVASKIVRVKWSY
ncbi:VRR-NUC domain-containing protein [Ravibacter arvi]|uniref:phosphodiesterase I n=1 Tax=Ravibacter arvi TaxID=2051041 RepID=A0ABP8LNI0_9BACT